MTPAQKLYEIICNIPGRKIVSFQGISFSGDFDMLNSEPKTMSKNKIIRFFSLLISSHGGIIVRQFSDKVNADTNMSIKFLHGFICGNRKFMKLMPDEVEKVHNHSSLLTNKPHSLPKEIDVVYV